MDFGIKILAGSEGKGPKTKGTGQSSPVL